MVNLRSNTWAITIGAAFCAGAYLWFSFLPQRLAIAAVREETASKLAMATQAARISIDLARVDREADDVRESVARWGKASGSSAEMATMFGEVSDVLNRCGVETTRFAPDSPVVLNQIRKVTVRIGCRGSYQRIAMMVAGIESLSFRVWIEEMTLEPTDGETGRNEQDVQCEINLAIFANNPEKSG